MWKGFSVIDPRQPDYCSTPVAVNRPHFSYFRSDQEGSCALGIITFCYNAGPLFEETIHCILHQSFQNFEWVIVDDGSTDIAFVERLVRLESEDSRVRVIRQENHGPAAARKRAVREAKADYIFQIDSGDLVEPTFAEKCLWALVSNPQYSFCNSYAVVFGDRAYLWPIGFQRGREFYGENWVAPHAVIRRAAHLAVGGYDETIHHGHKDWDYWFNMADKGHWGYTIPEYLIWYRWRANSHTRETTSGYARHKAFRALLHHKYPNLLDGSFPNSQPQDPMPFETICDELPFRNPISKPPGQKRLLMLVPRLSMGGAGKFNLDLVEQLSKRGYEITICVTMEGDNPWLPEFARFTPDIFILDHFLRLADYPRFLRYLIESRQIDVVLISNSPLGYQLLPYLRSRCPGVTFVDYSHMEEESWKNGGHPRSGVGYQELLDLNVVSTHHLKEWMVARGADGSRIEVCYTNIDPEEWDPAQHSRAEIRRSLGVSETVPLILYAGRLCDQKRPQLFAEVMLELARQKEFLCLVAGDGEARRFLEIFIRRHRLGQHVRLLGAVSNERMRELMAAADIFFLPSQWEGIALTLFEAMAMGVVPVAADVGGQRELVRPECGFLIPQGENEVQEYVSALKQLLESPELRVSMGQAGRRRIVEHFPIDRMAERMVELLNRAQELSRASPRPAVGKGLGLECATLAIEYTRLEQFADRHWTRYYLPVKLAELFKMDMSAAKRMYWTLSAMPGVKGVKSLVARLLGGFNIGTRLG